MSATSIPSLLMDQLSYRHDPQPTDRLWKCVDVYADAFRGLGPIQLGTALVLLADAARSLWGDDQGLAVAQAVHEQLGLPPITVDIEAMGEAEFAIVAEAVHIATTRILAEAPEAGTA